MVFGLQEYPILKKRFGSLLEKDDVRHELIANAFSRSLRTPKVDLLNGLVEI